MLPSPFQDFNSALYAAIEDTISDVLGKTVLSDLFSTLTSKYDVSRDELPYRAETMYQVLETRYSVIGAKTVGTLIARRLYHRLGLTFYPNEGYSLPDYAKAAKIRLAKA